jgi:hypothetical protein
VRENQIYLVGPDHFLMSILARELIRSYAMLSNDNGIQGFQFQVVTEAERNPD